MEEQGTIKINAGEIKGNIKKIINNGYTLLFSLLAVMTLLLVLLKILGIGSGVSFLAQLFSAFSTSMLVFFLITLVISATLAHYRKFKWMFLPLIIWLLVTTVVIRTANISQLKDITTGNYTLGPDLDPFLYLRHATEISQHRLEAIDHFREAPLGTKNYALTNMMPWVIFYMYKLLSTFSDSSIAYAAIITPVVLFIISLLGFLLFMRELASTRLSGGKSWLVAVLASFFYAFIPSMLHRTVAGIPEIESLGMAWFWFAFLFFTLAYKAEGRKKQIGFGILAGILTGLMSWSWGGYRYIYMVLGLTALTIFLFRKDKKISIVFSSWAIPALIIEFLKIKNIITILSSFGDVGFAFFVFFIIAIDFVLSKSKIKEMVFLKKINLPDHVKSLLIGIILGLFALLIIKPSFISGAFSRIIEGLLYPFGNARVSLTVAENKAPYLKEVLLSFGSLFWIFLAGNVILFYEATKHFEKKKKFLINFMFIIFLLALGFTRFSETSLFNGENFISKIAYLGSLLLFATIFMVTYLKAHTRKDEKTLEDFNNIEFNYVLILVFSFWAMVSMRGALRLFFIISPMLIIPFAFVPVKLFSSLKRRDDLAKLFVGLLLIIVLIFTMLTFARYSAETVGSVAGEVPSSYTQQWQRAMAWVRDETPKDSIFVHWWDYGYWVQTIGERPTVTDGAHANAWLDHTTARYLLTTPKPETALSLMKTHNVSYLLIDSTDLGKYPAYSSIGSDKSGDRLSQIPVMVSDPSQTVESSGKETKVYQGGVPVDEDISYFDGNNSIFLPANRALILGVIIETTKSNTTISFKQPTAVFFYNNQQTRIPVRYLYYGRKILDFGSGINSTARIMQAVNLNGQSISLDITGAVIYLSPKTSGSLFAQLYLMNDPNNEYPTVKLAHSEPDPIVTQLRGQGIAAEDLVYFQGFRGPINIWKIEYPSDIITREEFLKSSGEYGGLDNLTFTK